MMHFGAGLVVGILLTLFVLRNATPRAAIHVVARMLLRDLKDAAAVGVSLQEYSAEQDIDAVNRAGVRFKSAKGG